MNYEGWVGGTQEHEYNNKGRVHKSIAQCNNVHKAPLKYRPSRGGRGVHMPPVLPPGSATASGVNFEPLLVLLAL